MVIQNSSDNIMKTKKRKRQHEEAFMDPFETSTKQDKACQVNLYEEIIKVESIVCEEYEGTNNGVKSKKKKNRKEAQGETNLHKVDETNGEIDSTMLKMETIEDGDINVHSVTNVSEKITSKKRKKKKSVSLQESFTENIVTDISKEVPNLQIKSKENNETADCDIMLNVTDEPVKINANKDFFNDVHSKIQNFGKRRRGRKGRVSEPEEHMVIGDLESQIDNHERHEDGVKLSFKKSSMSVKTLSYHRGGSRAKQSYKHLIQGDLVLHFKNSNLHEVEGYAKNGQ